MFKIKKVAFKIRPSAYLRAYIANPVHRSPLFKITSQMPFILLCLINVGNAALTGLVCIFIFQNSSFAINPAILSFCFSKFEFILSYFFNSNYLNDKIYLPGMLISLVKLHIRNICSSLLTLYGFQYIE